MLKTRVTIRHTFPRDKARHQVLVPVSQLPIFKQVHCERLVKNFQVPEISSESAVSVDSQPSPKVEAKVEPKSDPAKPEVKKVEPKSEIKADKVKEKPEISKSPDSRSPALRNRLKPKVAESPNTLVKQEKVAPKVDQKVEQTKSEVAKSSPKVEPPKEDKPVLSSPETSPSKDIDDGTKFPPLTKKPSKGGEVWSGSKETQVAKFCGYPTEVLVVYYLDSVVQSSREVDQLSDFADVVGERESGKVTVLP